ncbi:DUF433 domain-containing protein [candidate division WWE3 bacterium]|nr:DUF433 domain-containing protein [candidate division WWE3 bacterium]
MSRRNTDYGHIQFNPQLAGGQAVFSGTGITVSSVLEDLSRGKSTDDILRENPSLRESDLESARRYAVQRNANVTLPSSPATDINQRSNGVSRVDTKGTTNLNRAMPFRIK